MSLLQDEAERPRGREEPVDLDSLQRVLGAIDQMDHTQVEDILQNPAGGKRGNEALDDSKAFLATRELSSDGRAPFLASSPKHTVGGKNARGEEEEQAQRSDGQPPSSSVAADSFVRGLKLHLESLKNEILMRQRDQPNPHAAAGALTGDPSLSLGTTSESFPSSSSSSFDHHSSSSRSAAFLSALETLGISEQAAASALSTMRRAAAETALASERAETAASAAGALSSPPSAVPPEAHVDRMVRRDTVVSLPFGNLFPVAEAETAETEEEILDRGVGAKGGGVGLGNANEKARGEGCVKIPREVSARRRLVPPLDELDFLRNLCGKWTEVPEPLAGSGRQRLLSALGVPKGNQRKMTILNAQSRVPMQIVFKIHDDSTLFFAHASPIGVQAQLLRLHTTEKAEATTKQPEEKERDGAADTHTEPEGGPAVHFDFCDPFLIGCRGAAGWRASATVLPCTFASSDPSGALVEDSLRGARGGGGGRGGSRCARFLCGAVSSAQAGRDEEDELAQREREAALSRETRRLSGVSSSHESVERGGEGVVHEVEGCAFERSGRDAASLLVCGDGGASCGSGALRLEVQREHPQIGRVVERYSVVDRAQVKAHGPGVGALGGRVEVRGRFLRVDYEVWTDTKKGQTHTGNSEAGRRHSGTAGGGSFSVSAVPPPPSAVCTRIFRFSPEVRRIQESRLCD
uniref:Uncharacterized protein n=1 Tax=Chromera velia CCMP2878 TaxID=1169474 RepID=A0A0G4I8J5_9ALVE|eukprot:Cvel_11983.t1-p1 / transcript=Cvel_11983.t1 / gene=Cvel_11983 / organism=Chromera_velia_CCMP2878 / gene_product=hypothetical protein / transcript_product=hypothetical protein / location=Cvel_scaffold768:49602-54041(+) / protein_length=691 / sequence_SO=supercontig / SO=protein_coding / is_pseudo=false